MNSSRNPSKHWVAILFAKSSSGSAASVETRIPLQPLLHHYICIQSRISDLATFVPKACVDPEFNQPACFLPGLNAPRLQQLALTNLSAPDYRQKNYETGVATRQWKMNFERLGSPGSMVTIYIIDAHNCNRRKRSASESQRNTSNAVNQTQSTEHYSGNMEHFDKEPVPPE